ncbi:MAG: peptidase S10 [Flavobacteriales bacterium]|nr:peptidase S10 [Flavobacteriales bacterium]HQZ94014.1 carboxypeptidase [Flavobacteriales bacterium]
MTSNKYNFMRPTLLLFFCAALLGVTLASAQDTTKTNDKNVYTYPETSTTKHSIVLNGERIDYTATVGHLILLDEKGAQRSHNFYIAYTRDLVKDPSKRPITFSFNGGPGSSSVWLHMGALGPKRVVLNDDGTSPPPPYSITDNAYSWLDKTDLVFIDPIETGYSRPAEGVDKKEFTGYSEDIRSVGDFIHKFITLNGRWASPKYLAGESYGTTRAAGLSGYLQDRHGMYLNGIVLISAVMNFQTLSATEGNDLPYTLFLPSFAATAYYHGKVDTLRFPVMKDFLAEVEQFAETDYTLFLMKGSVTTTAEKDAMAERMSAYIGIDNGVIFRNDHRIDTEIFTKELLRSESRTIGRFDGTVKGIDRNDAGANYDFDPSYSLTVRGPYTMAINEHLKNILKYENSDKVYEILTGNVHPWNFGDDQNRFLNNAEVLRSAIHKNPALRVLICNGYYDLATPYFATEYTVDHMFLDESLQKNITMTYYQAGHMMYTIKPELEQFTKDARAFYDR